jgi:hypothetical protein
MAVKAIKWEICNERSKEVGGEVSKEVRKEGSCNECSQEVSGEVTEKASEEVSMCEETKKRCEETLQRGSTNMIRSNENKKQGLIRNTGSRNRRHRFSISTLGTR